MTSLTRRLRTGTGLDLVLQREEVRAVEPRGDLRRSEDSFRHEFSVAEGCHGVRRNLVQGLHTRVATTNS